MRAFLMVKQKNQKEMEKEAMLQNFMCVAFKEKK